VVARLIEEKQAEVEWRPYYLRPDTPPEGMELPDYVKANMEETTARLKQLAEVAGLEMVFGTRLPNTRIAHEATEYARQKGKGFEFHHALFDKIYAQDEDISKWDVLQSAARDVGLDEAEMKRDVENGKYTAIVRAQVSEAKEIGVSSVPTYVLNDKYAIVGAQPYEAFLRGLEQIEQKNA